MGRLESKVALIPRAACGPGRARAIGFAEEGVDVVGVDAHGEVGSIGSCAAAAPGRSSSPGTASGSTSSTRPTRTPGCHGDPRGGRQAVSARTVLPVGRGDPADVTEALLHLASGSGRYVTGIELPVDAGHALR